MVKVNRRGCTRVVILTKRLAIKVPNFLYEWRHFLIGLLANMQERQFAKSEWPELCPVLWSIPGGWLVVMRRAEPLSDDEFMALDLDAFLENPDYVVPAERKADSFGKLDGRIVAVDYGS